VFSPATAVVGTASSAAVTAQDAFGNKTPSYAGTVSITSSDGAATLPAAHTFVPGTDAGAFTFAITFGTSGPQTVSAGKSISYATTVYGSVPITLQWYKGSTKITGATNASITLTNLQVSDSATYTLWATNGAGTASQGVNVSVLAPASYANATNGLVLHLRFEGDVNDSSGRGNNGTPINSPAFVPGIIGAQALQPATATNSSGGVASATYVQLGRPADLQFSPSQSFSVGLWVKWRPMTPLATCPSSVTKSTRPTTQAGFCAPLTMQAAGSGTLTTTSTMLT
jgi:hypothetical protein